MRCIGRTKSNKRCKKKCNFLVCKTHRKQLLILVFITVPTFIVLMDDSLTVFNKIRKNPQEVAFKELMNKIEQYNEIESILEIERQKFVEKDSFNLEVVLELMNQKKKLSLELRAIARGIGSTNKVRELIIGFHEKKEYGKAMELINSIYNIELSVDRIFEDVNDVYLGYIINSYVELNLPRKAISTLIKRINGREHWDYSLRFDLAYCLREHKYKFGLLNTLDLVDSLKRENNIDYLSPILTVIPLEVLKRIENGIYYRNDLIDSENDKKEILSLLSKYPDDKMCSLGYYYLAMFDNALLCNPDTRILDVLLYAIGYEELRQITELYDPVYSNIDGEIDTSQLNKAESYFQKYVKRFPNYTHTDDSYFWIAKINEQRKNYFEAINNLNKIGDLTYSSDFEYVAEDLRHKIHLQLTPKELIRAMNLKTSEANFIDEIALFSALDKIDINERIEIVSNSFLGNTNLQAEYAITMKNNLEFSNLKIWMDEFPEIKNINQEISQFHLLMTSDYSNLNYFDYISEVLKYKNKYKLYPETIYLLNRGIDLFSSPNQQSYLFYLKTRVYVFFDRSKLEQLKNYVLKELPNEDYTDDILAEYILVNYRYHENEEEAVKHLEILLDDYANSNAADNGVYEAINFYREFSQSYYLPAFYEKSYSYEEYQDLDRKSIRKDYLKKLKYYSKIFLNNYYQTEKISLEDLEEIIKY